MAKDRQDQTNISNAYTSGLKEEFGLYGNELNYFNVCYYTSYVIFQVPFMLLISRPKLYVCSENWPETWKGTGETDATHLI